MTNEAFFSNTNNKHEFIKGLSIELKSHGIIVEQSSGDADVLIAQMALRLAKDGKCVVVSSDDTDVFCILLYHWKPDMGDIFFRSEDRRGQRRISQNRIWNIRKVFNANESIVDHILFIHAWSGCDSTSAMYMQGKLEEILRYRLFIRHFSIYRKDKDRLSAIGIRVHAFSSFNFR